MYKEISLYNKKLFRREVIESLFTVAKMKLDGICLTPEFLPKVKEFINYPILVSSCVDYPGGFSQTEVRSHAAISCIRKGANCIDLVANNNLINLGDNLKKFSHDIKTIQNICTKNSSTLRVMLEYKYYDNKKILEIFSCLRDLGVEYAYLSTGKISDDITDYIAIARYASDFCGVSIIYNGIMWKYEHFKKVEESGVFGVSFKSLQNFNSVFGVL
jgi:deoxyribose-phosphate aldolase